MTNLEALKAVVQIDQIPAASFEKAIIDTGIGPDTNYSAGNASTINKAAVDVLQGLLVSSVSEGGYSISFDRRAVEAKIISLTGGVAARGVEVLNI